MKIIHVEDMHCDAGWRDFSFLKITTDDGTVGWCEYLEGQYAGGNGGALSSEMRFFGEYIIERGYDPMAHEVIVHDLRSLSIQVAGGIAAQAIACIENCCLDIKGKVLGVPVSTLLGGAMRDRLPVYWSHCGNARVHHHELVGSAPLRNLDDVRALGAEVAAKGLKGLKCNLFHGSGFGDFPGYAASRSRKQAHQSLRDDYGRNCPDALVNQIVAQMQAFREGAGPDMQLRLDTNYSFKTEGYIKVAKALDASGVNMDWLELDNYEPRALGRIRAESPVPIASLESLYGRKAFYPFLEASAVDVAIIDATW